MALFPVLIEMKDMPCLVAGGGKLALHKAELLCAQGARVTVVAPEICEEITRLPVTFFYREIADDTTAVFPAVHRQGRTVVAVSSAGASPAASTWLRDRLAEQIPDRMDDILERMAGLRRLSREYFSEQPVRRTFLRRCLDKMLKCNRPLTADETEEIRQAVVSDKE